MRLWISTMWFKWIILGTLSQSSRIQQRYAVPYPFLFYTAFHMFALSIKLQWMQAYEIHFSCFFSFFFVHLNDMLELIRANTLQARIMCECDDVQSSFKSIKLKFLLFWARWKYHFNIYECWRTWRNLFSRKCFFSNCDVGFYKSDISIRNVCTLNALNKKAPSKYFQVIYYVNKINPFTLSQSSHSFFDYFRIFTFILSVIIENTYLEVVYTLLI